MVFDKIENFKKYSGLGERIAKALEFVSQIDASTFKPGRVDLDGDNIFAIFSTYNTCSENDGKLEAHRKYIDVQFVAEGSERIGYAPASGQQVIQEYSDERDVGFYSGEKSFVKMEKGMFAIFFPHDIHMPGIKVDEISKVKKVVVKVGVE